MSILTSPAWLTAMHGRLPDTVPLAVDGVSAHAFIQYEPRPAEFYDLHHVLTTSAPALPITRTPITSPPWVPALTVMLPGYECLPVGPRSADPATLNALVGAALGYDVPTVAFLYTRTGPLEHVLADHGFTRVPLSVTWDLHLPGTGMADYLASFARKRRKEIRREMRSTVDVHREEPDLDELTALRCRLVEKYRGTSDFARERARLGALAAMDSITLVARPDKAVGFAMFARYGGEWTCVAVGFDYADERSRLAYFGTAFYAAAEHAYAEGVRTIGYGQGSGEAKRGRGCVGTPLDGWVRTSDPVLAEVLRVSAATTRREVL